MRGALAGALGLPVLVVALVAGLGVLVTAPAGEVAGPATAAQRRAATIYLAALDPLPEGWREGRFAPEPGVSLETGFLPARGARRGTAVFVPGYTAPLELYAAETARLAAAGWDVAALSPRGQGRSTRSGAAPDMGHVDDYDALVDDLAAFVAAQPGPVAVVGVSMGGHVALRLAAREGAPVAAVAAVVPMVGIELGPVPRWAARALAEVMARTGLGGRYVPGGGPWDGAAAFGEGAALAGTICADDGARAHLRDALFTLDAGLRVDAPSVGWVAATLRSEDRLAAEAPGIAVPVLVATAGRDRIVSTPRAAALCRRIAGCARSHWERAPHCILEGDRTTAAAVMERVVAFLAARGEPSE